jgi:serine/threonine protein kinase
LEESQSKKSAHFEKGPLIGKGSCGEVYECLNLRTGERVAVKEIRVYNKLYIID